MSNKDFFEGEVVTKWLKNNGKDRDMVLIEDFCYIDQNKKKWIAKSGDIINGASIPAFLWGSLLGSPFVGDYRRATVLHDVACDKKTDNSSDVHRMFYHAMLCDGVRKRKAFLMYKAVDKFGPDWSSSRSKKIKPSLRNFDEIERIVDQVFDELGTEALVDNLDFKIDELINKNQVFEYL